MPNRKMQSRESALADLDRADTDATLADGHQTVREGLSHFVFWHREYVRVVRALAAGRQPRLRVGKFYEFNAQATREFERASLPRLAQQFRRLQTLLERLLLALPDWGIDFPIKAGGKHTSVAERVPQITAHIRNHVARLQRAAKKRPVRFPPKAT